MRRGKLITLEGTDASGKANQLKRLKLKFIQEGISLKDWSFPTYDTPSGRIVAGPVLGKPGYGDSYFENPSTEDARAISMYYSANRRFELPEIEEALESGYNVALDRYVDSNKACQGGKIKNIEERLELYEALDFLEYGFAQLPRPDLTMLLFMPYEIGRILKSQMNEKSDRVEQDSTYLKNQEKAYLELAELNKWPIIKCFPEDKIVSVNNFEDVKKYIRSFGDIHKEIWRYVENILNS